MWTEVHETFAEAVRRARLMIYNKDASLKLARRKLTLLSESGWKDPSK